jgi:peptidoglycan/LPS O-acetylase OafA/YrhL
MDVWTNFLPVSQPGLRILITPFPIFFIVGLFASMSMRTVFDRVPPSVLILGAVSAWAVSNGIAFKSTAALFVMQALAFSIAILGALRMTFPKIVCKLGDYSYGIYLVHMIFLTAASKAIRHFAPELPLWACWAVMAMLAISAGAAFGKFEYRLHTRIAKKLFPRRQEGSTVSA